MLSVFAVYADESAIFMNNTVCSNNTGAQGGCLAANNATSLGLLNVQMQNNYAENGGGLYVSGCSELVVYNMSMQNNTATVNGGGIFQVSVPPPPSRSTNPCLTV